MNGFSALESVSEANDLKEGGYQFRKQLSAPLNGIE
jgi:hypothetical protein